MSVKLYVGNLSYDTTAKELRELFSAVGSVASCSVVDDRNTGRSRGFGFVEMSSKAEGENAVAQLDGRELGGRRLTVNVAKPRVELGSFTQSSSLPADRSFATYATRAYFKEPVELW